MLALLLSCLQTDLATLATARSGHCQGAGATIRSAGRALVTARTDHVLVASAPLLGHPAEEVKPPESMLAALATCDIFVCESRTWNW